MDRIYSFFLCFFILFFSCQKTEEAYVMNAFEIIKENAIHKSDIDWEPLEKEISIKAKKAYTKEEAYEIIKNILPSLKDNHSLFIPPKKSKEIFSKDKELPIVVNEILNDSIGYIKIPSFTGNTDVATSFAQEIQEKIKVLANNNAKDWIIDLRENTGGNMWPMLLGLSPLLDDGILGYFAYGNGIEIPWELKKNSIYSGKLKMVELSETYVLNNKRRKIAVLINHKTCSSAEAVTIAFSSLKNVKLIGGKTCGRSTSNSSFKLDDGAILAITTAVFMNRDKEIYGKEITPDLYAEFPKKAAILWMQSNSEKD